MLCNMKKNSRNKEFLFKLQPNLETDPNPNENSLKTTLKSDRQ